MAWGRREPRDTVTVRRPASESGAADARRDRSFSSCLVRAMALMLAMPLLGAGAAAGSVMVALQLISVPLWLGPWLFFGGLAGGFSVGMHLVMGVWGPRLSAQERAAELVVRDDRFRGGAFAMVSHTAVLALTLGVVAVGTGRVSVGIVALVSAIAAVELMPAALFGLRIAGDELVIRGIAPLVRRIDRAEIVDMGVRQRHRGWSRALYVTTRDGRLTRIPLVHQRSSGDDETVVASWVGPLRSWWQHGYRPSTLPQ